MTLSIFNKRRIVACLATTIVAVLSMLQPASAAFSSAIDFFVANIKYTCYSEAAFSWDVSTSQDIAVGCGYIGTYAGGAVAAGYMAAQGTLMIYESDDTFSHSISSGMLYSDRTTNIWMNMADTPRVSGIRYRAQGLVMALDDPVANNYIPMYTQIADPITG